MFTRILPLILALGLASLPLTPAHAAQITPTPRASELPVTATNRPFLGAAGAVQPVDLAAHGYVEKEFLVSGLAGVYDWAAPGTGSSVRLRGARVPYTTRLLLRAPADPRRANGRVIVELLDATAQYETAPLWGLSWQHFLRRGDIWIGLTVPPDGVDTLRRFDRVRYAALSFAGTDSSGCTSGPASAEAGLAWDLIAQVGALLRSSSRENPLVGFDVKHVIAAGYGQAGSDVVTFVNAVHNELRLGNEQPVFDAYLAAAYSDGPASLGGCAGPALTQNPRQPLQPRDVPFVAVMTQADVERAPGLRRADSDAAEDVFRLYEVAGAGRRGTFPAGESGSIDLKIAARDPFAVPGACVESPSALPVGLAFNAIWAQVDDLLERGTPLAHGMPVEVTADGHLVADALGNVRGGVRLPQIDMPLAVYGAHSTARDASKAGEEACASIGWMRRFDTARLRALYGNRAAYLKRFSSAVDAAVAARWLDAADAAETKAQAARVVPVF